MEINNKYYYKESKCLVNKMDIRERVEYFKFKKNILPILDRLDLHILSLCSVYADDYYVKNIEEYQDRFIVELFNINNNILNTKSKYFYNAYDLNKYILDECKIDINDSILNTLI